MLFSITPSIYKRESGIPRQNSGTYVSIHSAFNILYQSHTTHTTRRCAHTAHTSAYITHHMSAHRTCSTYVRNTPHPTPQVIYQHMQRIQLFISCYLYFVYNFVLRAYITRNAFSNTALTALTAVTSEYSAYKIPSIRYISSPYISMLSIRYPMKRSISMPRVPVHSLVAYLAHNTRYQILIGT